MGKKADAYETELETLQLALVRWQERAIAEGRRTVVVFEGRDAAGKDGAIKRIIEHLSPRYTRVAALPKPSDRERGQWFLQRYIGHLPAAGELVIFNRSWYNRAGVEVVMGFSTTEEQALFLKEAPAFERMLIDSGAVLVKLWLDISRDEQAQRLEERRTDPLKALKVSALDAVAQEKWTDYSAARDRMLAATHTEDAPWTCVVTDDKRTARLSIMRVLLARLSPDLEAKTVDPDVVFAPGGGALAA